MFENNNLITEFAVLCIIALAMIFANVVTGTILLLAGYSAGTAFFDLVVANIIFAKVVFKNNDNDSNY